MQFFASLIDVDGILRDLWASLCQLIYRFIAFFYELFTNLASVKLLTQEDIKPIYQRVTLILTIIMVFYVTLEVVKYVVEPDKMTDKEKGASNVVKHMIIVVLLIAFVPTIFEKAYDLQNSLIKNQVIPQLILGRQGGDVDKQGKVFSAQMFSLFYKYDDDFWMSQGKTADQVKKCDGTTCAQVVKLNISTLANDGELPYIHMGLNTSDKVDAPSGNKQDARVITFDGLFAVVVGVFICYVLLLYCIDVGVRVAQLLFLQIIAPIPIIGYLSPKKDGIFQKWIKQCVTTYLDLFIRITIICFVLLIVEILGDAYHSQTLVNGIGSNVSNTMRTFMYIAIVMGLLLFAQKAPKMLQELFPKMGAASGNFGLKAGERVAPAAARAIGAGTGFARTLVGGAIRRQKWRTARNKANGWATGFSRFTSAGRAQNREKREEIKKNKESAKEARLNQKKLQQEAKQKGKFDSAREAWNKKQEGNEKINRLKEDIKKAHARGDDAEARRLGKQLQDEYKKAQNSSEYRKWNAARDKMATSSTADKMRQENAERWANESQARDRMNQANSVRDAAQRGRDAAANKRSEVLRKRDVAGMELAAAQQELTRAQSSGSAADIAAAQQRVNNAQANYNNADKEAKEVLGGRDAAINERNAAIVELDAAQQALERAEESGTPEEIAAAQERVRSATENYNNADKKVNEIVSGAASLSNARAESDAARQELAQMEIFGTPEQIEAARRRVEEADRNVATNAAYEALDAANSERRNAHKAFDDAVISGDFARIAEAKRRMDEADKNYDAANDKISQIDKNYKAADEKYRLADSAATKASEDFDKASTARIQQSDSNRGFFDGKAEQQYAERLNEANNNVTRTNEQVIEDKNKHYQGFAGSSVSTVAGAFKAAATGAKAKKLEEVHKQVEQAVKNDIANVKAVQKYYDEGGTGLVDRTVQQVNKKVGAPTTYERTVLQNQALEPKIKRLEAQAGLTSDVKSTADGAEDRLKDKINDLVLVAESGTIKTVDANGQETYVEVMPGETLGAVYRRYQGMEAKAQTDAETAAKRLDEFKANNPTVSIPEGYDGPLSVEQQQLRTLQEEANRKATQASNAKYATTLVHKNAARQEYSAILKEFATRGVSDATLMKIRQDDRFEGVAVEKVYDALKSLEVARSNPEVVEGIRINLGSNSKAFDAFMTGNIRDFKTLDDIKTAAINAGNTYNRDAKELKEEKRSSETSNQTSAQKAAQDYNGSGSGGK